MKKKKVPKPPQEIIVTTDLNFEELMNKALNTPLPKLAKDEKKGAKKI